MDKLKLIRDALRMESLLKRKGLLSLVFVVFFFVIILLSLGIVGRDTLGCGGGDIDSEMAADDEPPMDIPDKETEVEDIEEYGNVGVKALARKDNSKKSSKDGLLKEKYSREFDKRANKLGTSREKILSAVYNSKDAEAILKEYRPTYLKKIMPLRGKILTENAATLNTANYTIDALNAYFKNLSKKLVKEIEKIIEKGDKKAKMPKFDINLTATKSVAYLIKAYSEPATLAVELIQKDIYEVKGGDISKHELEAKKMLAECRTCEETRRQLDAKDMNEAIKNYGPSPFKSTINFAKAAEIENLVYNFIMPEVGIDKYNIND